VGLALALAAECPELRLRCIEATPAVAPETIRVEALRRDVEPWVRLDEAGRWRPRLARLEHGTSAVAPRLAGTVLISGGFGAIGRAVADWAAAHGAEAVVLVGRRRAPVELPVPVVEVIQDVADATALDVLSESLRGLPPLGMVVHAAGVRGDGLLPSLSSGDLAASLRPKLAGARTLHALTQRFPARHFLLFGSVASFIGAVGQASYASANAALVAFAEWRRAQGLPAKVIEWGRWAGAGMAGDLSPTERARVDAHGVLEMPPEQALRLLGTVLERSETRIVIASFDLERLVEARPWPIFERLAPPAATSRRADEVGQIVARVLGREVDAGTPLTACGLDSLMAVDLRNRLNRSLGASLQLGDLLTGIDLDGLRARVALDLGRAQPSDHEVITL
jgi:NAD(P)-dependent dehydrogenase (short-subunit alcohol dehydrogenase family)